VQTQTDLAEEILLLRQENTFLKEELAQLKRLIFGSKKERFITTDTGQTSLFETTDQEVSEAALEEVSYTREKTNKTGKAKRLLLPAHLLRKEEIIEPEGLDKENSIPLGEKVTEILEYTPGKFYVRRIVRPTYKQADKIITAELPTLPIPNGNAGASILAYLLVSKFVDHLPFYRQVQIFKRDGIKIAESTITGWFNHVCRLMEPLYEHMLAQLRETRYIQADETPIPVQSSHKKGATHKGYHWVYHLPEEGIVVFNYQKSRSKSAPEHMLKDFTGCLQTDGYAAYDELGRNKSIVHLGCMAHARRKFDQAKDNDQSRASHVLTQIQELYALERKADEDQLTEYQRQQLRDKKATPILSALKIWLSEQYTQVLPRSSIGKAIGYSLRQWDKLSRYTENGGWKIDNNGVENKIRPVALGRKNYLFAGSHQAAQQAAMIYSFFGTCKLNNVDPLSWLKTTLENIPDCKVNQIQDLLPKSESQPTPQSAQN
jgi:transposase